MKDEAEILRNLEVENTALKERVEKLEDALLHIQTIDRELDKSFDGNTIYRNMVKSVVRETDEALKEQK